MIHQINVYSYLIAIKEYSNDDTGFPSKLDILTILKETAD